MKKKVTSLIIALSVLLIASFAGIASVFGVMLSKRNVLFNGINVPNSTKKPLDKNNEEDLKNAQLFNLEYDAYTQSYKILAYVGHDSAMSTIPSTYCSDPIDRIGDRAFLNHSEIKSIKFKRKSNIKSIGQSAFSGTSIETITLPASLEKIDLGFLSNIQEALSGENQVSSEAILDARPFMNCAKLTSIIFEKNSQLTTLPDAVFIIDYDLSATDSSKVFNSVSSVEFGANSALQTIDLAFYGATNLTSLQLPASLTTIGSDCFSYCYALSYVSFEANSKLTSIGENAFAYSGLTSISLQNCTSLTSIGNGAFSNVSTLKSVIFPSTMEIIGNKAFLNCGLTSLNLPSSIKTVGSYAFQNNPITSLTLNSGLQSIGDYAFSILGNLGSDTTIAIPNTVEYIGNKVFSGTSFGYLTLQSNSVVTYIGDEFFAGRHISNLSLPETLVAIGQGLFKNCTDFSSFNIYKSKIDILPAYTFYNCTGLTSISLPETLQEIGQDAFYGLDTFKITIRNIANLKSIAKQNNFTNITVAILETDQPVAIAANLFQPIQTGLIRVDIPANVTEIGDGAFRYCYKLARVQFTTNSQLTKIGTYAFSGCTLLKYIFLDYTQLTSIGTYAFESCTTLTSLTFPSTLQSIGDTAYSKCNGLLTINFPSSLTELGYGAFSSCSNLKYLNFPEDCKLTTIDENFNNCTSLKTLTLPKSIKILTSSFNNCSALNTVGFEDGNSIEELNSCFEDCTALNTLTIPSSILSISGYFSGSKAFNIEFTSTGTSKPFPKECSLGSACVKSITLCDDYTSLPKQVFEQCTSLTTASLSSAITEIPEGCFVDCTALKTVYFSSNVTTIGSYAFAGCSALLSISIPQSTTHINSNAFSGCTSLKNITIAQDSSLQYIGVGAFENCGNSATTPLTIDIPVTVSSIDNTAFSGTTKMGVKFVKNGTNTTVGTVLSGNTTITSVSFSSDITQISSQAFSGCTALKSIRIPSTIKTLGDEIFSGCTALATAIFEENANIDKLGARMFENCTSLATVKLGFTIVVEHQNAFTGCTKLKTIYVPSSMLNYYKADSTYTGFNFASTSSF